MEKKSCKQCQAAFTVTDSDLAFYDKVAPTFAGKKFEIPTPQFCPDCRQQRRMNRRNERKLYKRKSDFSGKSIIAIYSLDAPYKVYSSDERRSDKRDGLSYGRDFDFSKTFTEQFDELLKVVPHLNLYCLNNENSEYTHGVTGLKNCYLLHNSDYVEDSYYGTLILNSKDCVDCNMMTKCEVAYDSYNCTNGHKIFFSRNCADCSNVWYCNNCINCNDCFMCSNIVNKKYCIENKEYSKEEYESKIAEMKKNGLGKLKKQSEDFFLKFPMRYYQGVNNENSTGNYLNNTKNATNCYQCTELEDATNCIWIFNSKSCQDFTVYGDGGENIYNAAMVGPNGYNVMCSAAAWHGCRDVYYSFLTVACKNCFGCMSLRDKEYCIFNKQYTREEYNELVPKIIAHMQSTGERGNFLDISICPRGYNETMGDDYLPMTKEEALKKGYKRMEKEYPINVPAGMETMDAKDISSDISTVSDGILKKAILCEKTGKPYRIMKPELEFYRTHNLPIPRKHPDVRHTERVGSKTISKIRDKKCDKCGIDIKTTFAPGCPEIVYCEACYNKEIYG